MKHKVAELEGALLDAAVAIAEGGVVLPGRIEWPDQALAFPTIYQPTESWADGGPIIEREQITLLADYGGESWTAGVDYNVEDGYFGVRNAQRDARHTGMKGPTPLVAAMRAFVESKLGDEIELP